MMAPKQEKWSYRHCDQLRAELIVSVGAVFDWYAGNVCEIALPIWWRLHLGWLVRALQRSSLLRRNTPNYWIFFKHMIRSLVS